MNTVTNFHELIHDLGLYLYESGDTQRNAFAKLLRLSAKRLLSSYQYFFEPCSIKTFKYINTGKFVCKNITNHATVNFTGSATTQIVCLFGLGFY